jgi:DNA mismatch repair protein MutS2
LELLEGEIKMIEKSMRALEFDKILEMLSNYAVSDNAKMKLTELKPYLSEREVIAKLKDTTEARMILDHIGTPPMASMKDIEMLLELSEKGAMLVPEQLTNIELFITACKRLKGFLKRAESLRVDIAGYGGSIHELNPLSNDIEVSIRNNRIEDNASKELKDIRRKMDQLTAEMKVKLESLLRSKKEWFTDGFVVTRNGHFALPVKKEFKNQVSGSVLDISSTGSTYFIEPNTVAKLKEELSTLEIAESNEERRILYQLTAEVCENAAALRLNMEAMETLDFIFAKAKLSMDMKAVPANINTNRYIRIVNGRHPLIKASDCVPLNFTIGNDVKGIVITGPNTGGKTVALKTVGLLALMAGSGLHVPCEAADLCMNNAILCDIGDGQSITENLSTFSSHISNIINIIAHTNRDSLVLLDELGSGTDPAEGMGIAIAILEELMSKDCLLLATTHYPEVKDYANKTEGLINAKMAFDRESLKPLYRLEIGEAGESCALYIAKRLGLPKRMLERAYQEAYCKENISTHRTIDTAFIENAAEGIENKAATPGYIERIKKIEPKKEVNTRSQRFNIGDSVVVYPQKKIGIVFKKADEKGEVGVQIQKKKEFINHKRLQLKVAASEMYPEDYDFSIVFDSVANRKARHKMEKGYQPDLEIVYEKEQI